MDETRIFRLAVVMLLTAILTALLVIALRLGDVNEQLCELGNNDRDQFAQLDCGELY